MSLGDDPQTFDSQVFGSVSVPEVVGSTPGACPLPIGERKVVVFVSAFGAELGRRKEPVYLDEVLAVPQGFILDLAQPLAECGVKPACLVLVSAFRLTFRRELYAAFFASMTYEAPWGLDLRAEAFDQQLGALKKMCGAVVAGRCEHRIATFSLWG